MTRPPPTASHTTLLSQCLGTRGRRDCRETGATLAAPALLSFEVANIVVKKLRRHPEQRTALRAAHAFSLRLSIEIVAIDTAAVVSVAEETDLTAYDASYLWLARQLRADLVTLDAELGVAAGS